MFVSQYNVLGRLVIHISGATGFDYSRIRTTEANGFLDPVKFSTQFLSVNYLSPASYENRKWKSPHINNICVAVRMESLTIRQADECYKSILSSAFVTKFCQFDQDCQEKVKKTVLLCLALTS